MTDERVLPHDLKAERAVLGAVLVNPDLIFEVHDLKPTEFFRDGHKAIWRVMLAMATKSEAIDPLTVRVALGSELAEVGGAAYIATLLDGVPRSSNVKFYARIVREKAQLRAYIDAADRMLGASYGGDADPAAILNDAQRALVALAHETSGRGLVSAEEGMAALLPVVERILETKAPVVGLATGYADLDRLTRGLRPGELILLAARPSMGKTSLVGNIAERVSSRGDTVAFFSLEMSRDDVMLRMLASSAKLDFHRFMSGWVNQSDYASITTAISEVGRYALYVDDGAAPTLLGIAGQCRRLSMQHGLSLVILDYLQLMPVPRSENRNIAIAELSRGLKHLARELQVPVIALSQLSRDIEKRGGEKKPQLSDLRDSGALEQDADQVWFIHRPEVYASTPENRGKAELHVAKSRNGPTGIVPLVWRGERMSFEDAA